MAGSWRTIKVFISSTFRDMEAERDHLVRIVFPKLREKLLPRHIHLVDVDLRWGVTSDQDTLEVCREIIDECRPRFLCILGERYGWIPSGQNESITVQEIRYAVLNRLETKEYRFFYFRDTQTTEAIPEAAARTGGYREFPLPEEVEKFGTEESLKKAQQRSKKLNALKQEIIEAGYSPYCYTARWDEAQQRLVDLKDFGDRIYSDLLGSIDEELGEEPHLEMDEFASENAAVEVFVRNMARNFVVGNRRDLLAEMTTFAEGSGAPNIMVICGPSGSGKSALLANFYQTYLGTGNEPHHSQDLVIPHFIGISRGSTDLRRTLRRFCHELYRQGDLEPHQQAYVSQVTGNDENVWEDKEDNPKELTIPQDVQELNLQFRDYLKQAASNRQVVLLIDALDQFDNTGNAFAIQWLPYDLSAKIRVIITTLANHPTLESLRRRGKERVKEKGLAALAQEDRHSILNGFLHRYRKQMEKDQIDNLLCKEESGNPLYLLTALEELRTLGTYEDISQHINDMPDRVEYLFGWIFKRLENDPNFQDLEGQPLGKKLVTGFASLLGVSRFGLSETELAELLAPGDPEVDPPIPADSEGNVAALVRLLRPYLMYRGELIDFYHSQFRQAVESTYLHQGDSLRHAHNLLAEYFQHKADPGRDRTWRGGYSRSLAELPYHLAHSRQSDILWKTLTDFRFLEAKIKAFGVHPLINDYDLAALNGINLDEDKLAALGIIQEAWRLSAHVLDHDPDQQAGQLTGRLIGHESPIIQEFLKSINLAQTTPWLRPLSLTMIPAGGPLRYTLTGHTGNMALWPERGWAVSASIDNTLEVWELKDGQKIYTLAGHKDSITSISIWGQKGWAVSTSLDQTLKVWDLETGQEIYTLTGHTGYIDTVALWPERSWAVSTSGDRTIKVWDLETGKEIRTISTGPISALALWPERDRAVAISGKTNLKVWDLLTGQELHTLSGHTDSISALALWPERGWAVSAAADQTLKVWDLEMGRELHSIGAHNGYISTLFLWPERGWAVSGSFDKNLRLWDLERWQELNNFLMGDGKISFDDAALWPSESMVVWASANNTLRVWSRERGQEIQILSGHNGAIKAVALCTERNWAVSASEDGTLKLWDLESGQELRNLTGHQGSVNAVALWPERSLAVSASEDLTLKVWNLESGQELHTLTGHEGNIRELTLWRERGWALSAADDGTIKVWDLESGQEIRTLIGDQGMVEELILWPQRGWALVATYDFITHCSHIKMWDLETGQELHNLEGQEHNFHTLAFWAERGWIVAASGTTLKVWELVSGEELHSFTGHDSNIIGVGLWPERGWAFSVSSDNTLKLWDLERGQELQTFTYPRGKIMTLLKDGLEQGWAALSSYDHTIKAWDLESGQETRRFFISSDMYHDIIQWPEHGLGVAASADYNLLKVWDLETGQELHTLTSPTSFSPNVALWPERNWLVTSSKDFTREDCSIEVWDLKRIQEVKTCIGHNDKVTALALWPERGWVLSAAENGTLKVWDTEAGQVIQSFTGYGDSITALALWPERGWAIIASSDYTCRVLDLNRGQELYNFTQPHGWITDITIWSKQGWAILGSREDGALKIWDLVRGEEIRTLDKVLYRAMAAPIFWPERGWAILGSVWGTVDVWDLKQGQKIHSFTGDNGTATAMGWLLIAGLGGSMEEALHGLYGPVTAVALWPVKGWIVAAFWNGSLKVWDLKRGQEVWTLTGHYQGTNPMTLWPRQGLAVSASGEALKVWNLKEGQEVCTLTGHKGRVTNMALWPEWGLLVSASGDTLKVWDLLYEGCISTFVGESAITVFQPVPEAKILVVGEEKGRVHFLKLENFEGAPEKAPEGSFKKWIRKLFSGSLSCF